MILINLQGRIPTTAKRTAASSGKQGLRLIVFHCMVASREVEAHKSADLHKRQNAVMSHRRPQRLSLSDEHHRLLAARTPGVKSAQMENLPGLRHASSMARTRPSRRGQAVLGPRRIRRISKETGGSNQAPVQDQKDLTAAFKMSRQLVSHFFAVCSVQVAVQLADKNPPVPVAHPISNCLVIDPRHHAMGNEIVPEPLECDPIKPK